MAMTLLVVFVFSFMGVTIIFFKEDF